MAFCPKCGATIADDATVCPVCGAVTSPAPVYTHAESDDVSSNKTMAILGYIGILVVIPLATGGWRTSPFLKFHTNQSLILWIGVIVADVVLGILSNIPILGLLFALVSWLVGLVGFILMIIGIVNVTKGEAKPLPVIGQLLTILK
jgi:uncharacterized membrane protein